MVYSNRMNDDIDTIIKFNVMKYATEKHLKLKLALKAMHRS